MKQVINFPPLAAALGCDNIAALRTGYQDGFAQGFGLSMGMTYDDLDSQDDYDVGTYIGACAAAATRAAKKQDDVSKEEHCYFAYPLDEPEEKETAWTLAHQGAARREGWCIGRNYETGAVWVTRTTPYILTSDGTARRLVCDGVEPHHVAAREFLKAHSPAAYAGVMAARFQEPTPEKPKFDPASEFESVDAALRVIYQQPDPVAALLELVKAQCGMDEHGFAGEAVDQFGVAGLKYGPKSKAPRTWYALMDTSDIQPLGERQDFFEADEAVVGNYVWLFDQSDWDRWAAQVARGVTP